MTKISDITGKRFGRLVAIKRVESIQYPCGAKLSAWECKCDCGNTKVVTLSALTTGNTQSCGCISVEKIKSLREKHGKSRERLYTVWKQMRKRCNNRNDLSYKYYGANGVKVAKEWDDYSVFRKWALENGYDPNAKRGKTTIDRINPFGNYCPDNCRIVSQSVQVTNTRKRFLNNGDTNRFQRAFSRDTEDPRGV